MQHTFFVAQNHLGGLDFHQPFQTVVADNYPAIEVVEVARGETSTIEGNQRTQFGGNHGNHLQDHPLGTVAALGSPERLNYLEAFQSLGLALLRAVGAGAMTQLVGEFVEVETTQQVVDSLGAHLGDKLVGIGIFEHLVFARKRVHDVEIFLFGEEVVSSQVGLRTRLYHDITLVIDHGVEFLAGQSQQIPNLVGQRTEIPDVGYGHHQLDVTHTFAAHLLLGHLDTASVADNPFVTDTFVLSAMALVVLDRPEYTFAEKTVPLGFIGTVVDGFGFQHLAARIFQNLFGRSQTNRNLRKVTLYFVIFSKSHKCLMYKELLAGRHTRRRPDRLDFILL